MNNLALPILFAIFVAAGAVVWIAGNSVSVTTDVLSDRWGLGDALGGLIILAIVTNLPETAIVISGAVRGDMSLALGNILGGIAAQTVVLVLLDRFGRFGKRPLTFEAASLTLVLEGLLVVLVLGLVLIGTQMPRTVMWARINPIALAIAVVWCVGVWLIGGPGRKIPWQNAGAPPDRSSAPRGTAAKEHSKKADRAGQSTAKVAAIFGLGALATLVAGVVLEVSSSAIADRMGMSGAIFGATVLAAATSLPELSTGLKSVALGDIEMAVGDIFGGNAFLPVLFLPAVLISGNAVLPEAGRLNVYLTAVGIVLTVVYIAGLLFRPSRRIWGMGLDSLIVLGLYAVSVAMLAAI